MVIVLSNLRGLKHKKRVRNENCHQDAITRNIKPKFPQQTTFFGTRSMELFAWKCQNVLFKTCIKIGRCYGQQGWADAVEKYTVMLQINSFKLSESLKSVAQGVLEIFEEVYLGGTMSPPPLFEKGLMVSGITINTHHTPYPLPLVSAFFFFFFFFTQVQTPVTLCSGEWWSILVVRLAHSADLRSRLRHVSSAPSVAYSTGCSRVVTHPGTNPARRCLTSVIWREPVCHRRLAVDTLLQ